MATGSTTIGFEEKLWQSADKLRSKEVIDAAMETIENNRCYSDNCRFWW